ncbi:MAG: hypothetical protein M1837_006957 [Sclerophora amabilis]|nr:MAG: hypothetical protein M1837_006957 [Sclerophora amabilis]
MLLINLIALASAGWACDSCYGPQDDVVMTRKVRRMQPESRNATVHPRAPLEWGQINFLHTTDTHGWLEGHLKERNYGADWGDFVTFSRHMKHKAGNLGVDLLLVDTGNYFHWISSLVEALRGDLHDGAGLSDATTPNGIVSNPIFENVDYDLLAIGNHELYVTEIAYETFNQFSKVYGDRYVTSNVEIINPVTGEFEYVGSKFRYFSTEHGLRIMSFGILFDFAGNTNVSRVTKAATLVEQQWFVDAVDFTEPIDLFVLLGHNPPRPTEETSTFGTVYDKIRRMRPDIPIQVFGGHTHVRDFVVYDTMATGLESGRYCETLGWLAMSGIQSSTFKGNMKPRGVPNPSRPASRATNATTTTIASGTAAPTLANLSSSPVYARRYMDWNRLTFSYHATGSQESFDFHSGIRVTDDIYNARQKLNLSTLYGCAPATYCESCQPFGAPGNIFSLLSTALKTTVVNESRADIPRLIIINTGTIRFDLVKGPFTYDDSFIVSPFKNAFQFIPDVPYSLAKQVLDILNAGPFQKRGLSTEDFQFTPLTLRESCVDPPVAHNHLSSRSYPGRRTVRRQSTDLDPGYVTVDDFGTDGDDTPHSTIPYYSQPNDLQANASFPDDGSMPETVDLIFLDFIVDYVLDALTEIGGNYSTADISYYLPRNFTTNSYIPAYAKIAWQENVPNCPVGEGVTAEAVKRERPEIKFDFQEHLLGGASIDATGSPLTNEALQAAKNADAVILGAIGGPKWGPGSPVRPEQGLLTLRKELGTFGNLRPCSFASPSLVDCSPLKASVCKDVDFTIVRELTGGIYFGARKEAGEEPDLDSAWDMEPYSRPEIERVTRLAAHLAMQRDPPMKVWSLDKANVLATSRLWRKVVTEIMAKEFPHVEIGHHLIDSAAMLMVKNPRALNGVVVTSNLFGDIISDEASVIPGSLGLLPSASLSGIPDGKTKVNGIYEPIHGSAPDISGRGIVNPVAAILSIAMLLQYSLNLPQEARAVETAVRQAIDSGVTTSDIGGKASTKEVGAKVVEELTGILRAAG